MICFNVVKKKAKGKVKYFHRLCICRIYCTGGYLLISLLSEVKHESELKGEEIKYYCWLIGKNWAC